MGLATEAELASLCPDCDEGAVPPVGEPYKLKTMVEKGLLEQPEVYFEAGDHEHLVRMTGPNFQALQANSEAVEVARHI